MSNLLPSDSTDDLMKNLINQLNLDTDFIDKHRATMQHAEAVERAVEDGFNYYDNLATAKIMLWQIGDDQNPERQAQAIAYWHRTSLGVEELRAILKKIEGPLGIMVYDE